MPTISDTQRRILKAASKQPKTDIREHMQELKSPAIRDKVVTSMLKNGLVVEDPDADGVVYIISEAGIAAIGGKSKPDSPAKKNASEAKSKAKTSAKRSAPKEKREGGSKKQTMIDMLSRKEGATIKQLMETIGWQKHSVHGAMANLKKEIHKKHGQTIKASKDEGEDRVYKIA
jgi:hypothetical protein